MSNSFLPQKYAFLEVCIQMIKTRCSILSILYFFEKPLVFYGSVFSCCLGFCVVNMVTQIYLFS